MAPRKQGLPDYGVVTVNEKEYPSHKGSIPSGYLTEANIDSILNAMNRGKQ